MSRSRRKHPYIGVCADSEKEDKRENNRRLRHHTRMALSRDPEVEVLPHTLDHSNRWLMNKDGKMEFNPEEYPDLMRK